MTQDTQYTRISTDYENNADTWWDAFRNAIETQTVPDDLLKLAQLVEKEDHVYTETAIANRFEKWVSNLPGYEDGPHAISPLLFYGESAIPETEDGEADYPYYLPPSCTGSGEFTIFNRFHAGCPEVFLNRGGDWFYEPTGYQDNNVYSESYATREAALEAAEKWEAQQEWEAHKDAE